jgi:four helix bundle protein
MTNRFHAHDIAIEWGIALGPALVRIAQRDADLGRQLRRAVASVPLNLAEGACRAGKDRMHHYRIAAGSAAEAQSGLRLALGWGHLEAAELQAVEALADRLRAVLWGLTQPRA